MSENQGENGFGCRCGIGISLERVLGIAFEPLHLPPFPDVGNLLAMTGMRVRGAADNCPDMVA